MTPFEEEFRASLNAWREIRRCIECDPSPDESDYRVARWKAHTALVKAIGLGMRIEDMADSDELSRLLHDADQHVDDKNKGQRLLMH